MEKQQVLDYFGARSGEGPPHVKAARLLGCTPENVLMWPAVGPIPAVSAFKLHVLTDGKLKVDPELYARIKVRSLRRRKNRAGSKR